MQPRPLDLSGAITRPQHAAHCALVVALIAGCFSGSEETPKAAPRASSLLLVTLDTTRADALTSFGGRPGITPHLDAVAEEGLSFDRAYTVAPLTLPSHASILTGLVPPRHGLRVNGAARLSAEAQTLAEVARAADLSTAAFVSAVVLDPAFGLDQGFEVYDAPLHSLQQADSHFNDRSGEEVVAAAARWLQERKEDERFFLWVHLWDAHGPWNPPPELRALAPDDTSGYLGDVALMDRAFGRLMAALGTAGHDGDTLVVVVGDHGEAFHEHGEFSHGALIFEPTMRVPLVLRFPDGYRAGERSDRVISVVDLVPTLVHVLGLPVPEGLDGRNLLEPDDAGGGAYLESYYGYLAYGWAPLVGYVDARAKYVHGAVARLFDPVRDPGEKRDLSGQPDRDPEPYRRAIRNLSTRPALGAEALAQDPSLRAGISALGYAEVETEGALPRPLDPVDRPDPLTAIAEHAAMLEALGDFNRGDYVGAEQRCRAVLARNPDNIDALERLGIALIRQQRYREAIPPLRRAHASGHGTAAGAVNLGTCYRKLEQLPLAKQAFEAALAIDASQVRAVRHLVDMHLLAGDRDRALVFARRFEQLTGETLKIP